MRSEWADDEIMEHILAALMPPNRLAIEMSMRYGMRIGDVLSLRTEQVRKGAFTYKEMKTGKSRRIRLCSSMQERLLQQAGRIFIFEHRLDQNKHRTRQAVYKDIIRAANAFRCKEHITPHSARKIYAVDALRRYGSMAKVRELLNHSDEAITMIYALADRLNSKNLRKCKK